MAMMLQMSDWVSEQILETHFGSEAGIPARRIVHGQVSMTGPQAIETRKDSSVHLVKCA